MKIYVTGVLVIICRHTNRVEIECDSEQEAKDLAFRLALAAANEGIE